MNQLIVKRAGVTEEYDEKKFYASIYSVCLALQLPSATAELIAEKVTAELNRWIANKHEVTSDDLRRRGAQLLELYNPEAAHIFKHQRNLGR